MSGGNHNASDARLEDDASSVIEWATANAPTTAAVWPMRRNGITSTVRKSKYSGPSSSLLNPSLMKRAVVSPQSGSSWTRPGSPRNSNARTPPAGGKYRSTVNVRMPSFANPGCTEKRDWAERIGYSNSTSSRPWLQENSVSGGRPGDVTCATASSYDANDLSDCSAARTETTRGAGRASPFS